MRLSGPNPICPDGHPLSVEITVSRGKPAHTVWRCLSCGWTHEEAS